MASKNKRAPAIRPRSRKMQGFLALLVAAGVASGAGAWWLSGSDSSASARPAPAPTAGGTAGDQYEAGIVKDFDSMAPVLVTYLRTLQNWRAHKVADRQVISVAQNAIADIADSRQALARQAPFDLAPRALIDYQLAADTYAQSATLARTTAAVPRGPLRAQLQLTISRVQMLADRVFDQGQAELKPYMTPDRPMPGVVVHKAAEVPSWATGEYAPGAPLAKVEGIAVPREYQETRPEQSFAAWAKIVRGAALPTAAAEAGAIRAGKTAALRAEATDFTKAADLLYAEPDPKGERLINTRLQLALLIDAEATQVAQAAALAPAIHHGEFLNVAKALAVVGDKLWDPRLGSRDTGL